MPSKKCTTQTTAVLVRGNFVQYQHFNILCQNLANILNILKFNGENRWQIWGMWIWWEVAIQKLFQIALRNLRIQNIQKLFKIKNIARIANAVHCHFWLSGNKDCHEFRFSIVGIVISVSIVTSLLDCFKNCQNCHVFSSLWSNISKVTSL